MSTDFSSQFTVLSSQLSRLARYGLLAWEVGSTSDPYVVACVGGDGGPGRLRWLTIGGGAVAYIIVVVVLLLVSGAV